jgi:hypothetical protein
MFLISLSSPTYSTPTACFPTTLSLLYNTPYPVPYTLIPQLETLNAQPGTVKRHSWHPSRCGDCRRDPAGASHARPPSSVWPGKSSKSDLRRLEKEWMCISRHLAQPSLFSLLFAPIPLFVASFARVAFYRSRTSTLSFSARSTSQHVVNACLILIYRHRNLACKHKHRDECNS